MKETINLIKRQINRTEGNLSFEEVCLKKAKEEFERYQSSVKRMTEEIKNLKDELKFIESLTTIEIQTDSIY